MKESIYTNFLDSLSLGNRLKFVIKLIIGIGLSVVMYYPAMIITAALLWDMSSLIPSIIGLACMIGIIIVSKKVINKLYPRARTNAAMYIIVSMLYAFIGFLIVFGLLGVLVSYYSFMPEWFNNIKTVILLPTYLYFMFTIYSGVAVLIAFLIIFLFKPKLLFKNDKVSNGIMIGLSIVLLLISFLILSFPVSSITEVFIIGIVFILMALYTPMMFKEILSKHIQAMIDDDERATSYSLSMKYIRGVVLLPVEEYRHYRYITFYK